MNPTFETLLLEIDEAGIALLTINRPDKLNALNKQVFDDLDACIAHIESNDAVKAVIITGAGEKAFVAGADIKELNVLDAEAARQVSIRGQKVFQRIEDLNIPAIAVVNGFALGGGAELALACHMRIASSNAMMGLPEVSLALIPGYGGTQRLTMIVGKAKATELILTGNFVKADEALRLGLVNSVSEESALEDAKSLVGKILKQGPLAIGAALKAIRIAGSPDGFEKEADLFADLFSTDDFKEGTGAFLEKRKPDFSGK